MKKGKSINVLAVTVAMIFGCLIQAQVSIAQTYPSHPVKLIVGFTPGGPASNVSTAIAKRVSEFMEQPLAVEYKEGAAATLAASYVAKAKPDGYTVFTGSDGPLFIAPLIRADLTYTLDDFVPIIGYAGTPTTYIVKKDRWKSMKEFIADANKNPGKYTYSDPGINSNPHFGVLGLCDAAGIDLKHVPFPGQAEAIAALLGGHIDMAALGGTGGLYDSGKIDVLAVAEKKRVSWYPNVPTLEELGYPVYTSATYFLCAPKGTPQDIVNKLYEVHQKAFAKYGNELAAEFAKFEIYPSFLSTKELLDQNKSRVDMFRAQTKKMGILLPNR
jgi:tripartite-type tricarboxylate transporter receptor subunit TctC